MMARRKAKMGFMAQLILVLVLVVILSFVFGNPLLAQTRSVTEGVMVKLGLKAPKPVEVKPTEPLRPGYVSVWKAVSADQALAALAVDDAELRTQQNTGRLVLKQFTIVKKLPIALHFDQDAVVEKQGVDDLSPWVSIRYCDKADAHWLATDDCRFVQTTLQDCADTRPPRVIAIQPPLKGECAITYAAGVLTIGKLPAGWYQFEVMPTGNGLTVGGKQIPFNLNTAIIRFKYEP